MDTAPEPVEVEKNADVGVKIPEQPAAPFGSPWPYPWMCGIKTVGREPPTFFPVDEKMAFVPAAILGFQHMIAMLIGLSTPATILGGQTNDRKTKLYLINASIIIAGFMTIVQSSGIKHPRVPFQWGAGTLSVMGVSFTTVPIAQAVVPTLMADYKTTVTTTTCDFNFGYFTVGSQAGGSPCGCTKMPAGGCAAGYTPAEQMPSWLPLYNYPKLAGTCCPAEGAFAFGGTGGPKCVRNCTNQAFDYAWGKMLGTLAFCALIPAMISLLDYKRITMLFPNVVVGPVVMLIGINLIGVGFGDWGGGTFCGQRIIYNGFSANLMSAVVTNDGDYGFSSSDGVSSGTPKALNKGRTFGKHMVQLSLGAVASLTGNVTDSMGNTFNLSNINMTQLAANKNCNSGAPCATLTIPNLAADYPATRGTTTLGSQTFYSKTGSGLQFTNFKCNSAGDVFDVYGAAEYVGLGFLTFTTILSVEVFGSPFMRNCSCVIGLLWGYAAATWSRHGGQKYVTTKGMVSAEKITFLWTKNNAGDFGGLAGPGGFFPISFYPPLIIPFFIVFIITTCETWADTQASMEASRLDTTGKPLQVMRQKGALLNDSISGIISALAGVLPLTTFAQNNGIIALTNVASRRVGVACGIWLLILGILSKIGAFIQAIPSCVLGGMTSFLFANILASGMHILLQDPGSLKRRNRFILAATMACGVGVTLWPSWARMTLWPIDGHMKDGSALGKAKRGVRDCIILILSTGFVFGFFVAFFLNLLLPLDNDHNSEEGTVHLDKVESPETLSLEEGNEKVATI